MISEEGSTSRPADVQVFPILQTTPKAPPAPHQSSPQPEPALAGMTASPDDGSSDRLCFFYGSLMSSSTLACVLDLAQEPALTRAYIEGYRTMTNGPFPALVRGNNNSSTVCGMVYQLVGSRTDVQEQITELENLEGEDYARDRVRIRYDEDGRVEWGWTFIWVGDEEELEEGVWDFEEWRRRWGR
ncbi:MAG: hypothetical protein Q9168_005459 [Polycauliona sp. 1 TL-2023]